MQDAEPATTRARTAAETTPENAWSVRLLTAKVAGYISRMPQVWVEGQVVQLTHRGNSSYLTLRDTVVDQSLSLWSSRRVLDAMPIPLVDGAHVVLCCQPSYDTKRGRLQFQALDIRPVGVGDLLARIEHLKRVLAAEGLFAAERKRPLPFLPATIGLICGRDSAAEHDVVVNARKRWPGVAIEIRRVAVQGATCVEEVGAALVDLDDHPGIDVIVIARGGGSLEDLLPFSNEALVRAVAAARTPVVSAIGHESDTPLVDLVADLRASTPTDAAKRIVPAVVDELAGLTTARTRLRGALTRRLAQEQERMAALRGRRVLSHPGAVLDEHDTRVRELRERGMRAMSHRIETASVQVEHLRARARALSPLATVDRGYALVADASGSLVTHASEVREGQEIVVRLSGGHVGAHVNRVNLEGVVHLEEEG